MLILVMARQTILLRTSEQDSCFAGSHGMPLCSPQCAVRACLMTVKYMLKQRDVVNRNAVLLSHAP